MSAFPLFAGLYRQQSLSVLASLGELMRAMAPLPGRKAIVLISEGLFLDNETVDAVRALGQTSDRTRVVLYGMHLDVPPIEASAKTFTTLPGQIEDRYGFDGMADVAVAGGGAALRVIGFADGPLSRIDKELSGYYVLTFRRDSSDRSGRTIAIKVKVNGQDVDIRARPSFTPR